MASKEHIRNELQACKEALLRCNAGGPAQGNAKLATHGLIDCGELKKILDVVDRMYTDISPEGLVQIVSAGKVHLQKKAFALTLKLRTHAITLLAMIENYNATWHLLAKRSPELLSTIKQDPFRLNYTREEFRDRVRWYVREGTTLELPAAADESSRAVCDLLTKQRHVIEQQLVATLVVAMQAAEVKKFVNQDGTEKAPRSSSSERSIITNRPASRGASADRRGASADKGSRRDLYSPRSSPRLRHNHHEASFHDDFRRYEPSSSSMGRESHGR